MSSKSTLQNQNTLLQETTESLTQTNQRQKLLLKATKEITEARDKFSIMIKTVEVLLQKLALASSAEVYLAFQEIISGGTKGYASFRMPLEVLPEGQSRIKLACLGIVDHTFSSDLPNSVEEAWHSLELSGCVLSERTLTIISRNNKQLLGVIQIKGINPKEFTDKEKEFIDTLSHFLTISLENIGVTSELERKVIERTKALNETLQQSEEQHSRLEKTQQQLQSINKIVKLINQETDFEIVLEKVLKTFSLLIPSVQRAFCMLYHPQKQTYVISKTFNITSDSFQKAEMDSEWFDTFTCYVDDFIGWATIAKRENVRNWDLYTESSLPRMVLSIPITLDQEVAAFFHFDNTEDEMAFSSDMLKIIGDLSEHITSAFIRSKMLKALQESQALLQKRAQELENQNTTLLASNRKLEDLNSTKEQLLTNLSHLYQQHFKPLQDIHEKIQSLSERKERPLLRQAAQEMYYIDETLKPMSTLYLSEKAMQSKRVLLAETVKKQQIIAKMALGGSGVELDIVSDIEEGQHYLQEKEYDLIFTCTELIDLARQATQQNARTQSVFMTSDHASDYLPILRQNPFLSNIITRHDEDRTFTLKNITSTVSKLITNDLFGLEKYLNWGVDVQQYPVINSTSRPELVASMESYFKQLGLRRTMTGKCAMVAEELLMNCIYDAPVDVEGKPLYNHLPRTVDVELKPEEQGTFRFACDGVLLAVSVEDPFGAFPRETILRYLESCYGGQGGTLQQGKGGAGRGLFQIIETADLVVFNVKPKIRTEVIAIFNINPDKSKTVETTSFHYFYG